MKRCLAFLLIFLFIFSSTTPASARCHPSYGFEAMTFGLDDQRTRFVQTSEKVAFWSLFMNNFGNSYSQPLILSGKRWGMEWPVIAALGGPEGDQRLRFWVVTRDLIRLAAQARKERKWLDYKPVSSSPVVGSAFIRSDATAPEFDPQRFYLGTTEGRLVIVDASDLTNPRVVFFKKPEEIDPSVPRSTDIVSAPLVVRWKEHTLVVTSMGNAPPGQAVKAGYYIWADPGTPKESVIFLRADAARTSSSPGLVGTPENPVGFYAGADNGYGNRGRIFYWEFDRILTETNGKVTGRLLAKPAKLDTLDSVVSSPCVSGDAAYFTDDKGNAYAVRKVVNKNGQIDVREIWTYRIPKPSFTHHSPALAEHSLYVPLGTKIGRPGAGAQGKGALLRVNRSDGQGEIVWSFYGYTGTSPAVWIRGGEPYLWIGTQGAEKAPASLVRLRVVGGSYEMERIGTIANPTINDPYGRGYSGGISIASVGAGSTFLKFLAVTGENGISAWVMEPFDAQVVSLDPGVPEGEKAKPGHKYIATVVFKVKSAPRGGEYSGLPEDWEQDISVGAFHQPGAQGTFYEAALSSQQPEFLGKINFDPEYSNYGWRVRKEGDTLTATFEWTCPYASKTKLAAAVNTYYPHFEAEVSPAKARLISVIGEVGDDLNDNYKEVEVPIEGQVDVAVSVWPGENPYHIHWGVSKGYGTAHIKVWRKDSGTDRINVKVVKEGPNGTKVDNISLKPGDSKNLSYPVTVTAPGSYVVKIQAMPVPENLEVYPQDNFASCTVRFVKDPPPKASTEKGITGELGGGGGTGELTKD